MPPAPKEGENYKEKCNNVDLKCLRIRMKPESAAPPDPPSDQAELLAAEEQLQEDLSAEEQMVRYEESLKDTDWGHQPC